MIRPTDDANNDDFWVAIAGPDIDWQNLSTSSECFIEGVKKLSGFHSLEVLETMTLNYYRYYRVHFMPTRIIELLLSSINIRTTDTFNKGRVFIAGGALFSFFRNLFT